MMSILFYKYADCRESEELSPEIFTTENFSHNQNQSLGNDKDVEMAGRNAASNSFKGLSILTK